MRIEINNLIKSFGPKTAVDIDRLSINDGDLLGLVGNNGAGKTTLFRLILDLLKADEGTIMLNNGDMSVCPAETEEWKTVTGTFIDNGFLIDFLTPEEYFAFVGKVNGLDKDTTESRVKEFEAFMGGEITGQKKLIRDLSAGNKQKVGIISAMLNRPQLLILDEPFNFLDPSSQNSLKKILRAYNHDTGATILISSHNLQHTIDISTRIVLLEKGLIAKDITNENGSAAKQMEEYFNTED